MAITRYDPNTILLHPVGNYHAEMRIENSIPASEAITPGHLVEQHDSSGIKWRKNASATEYPTVAVALEFGMMNRGVDDDYAEGESPLVAFLRSGDIWWGLIASGQDITYSEYLQPAGDGTLKSATATTAAANLARFQSLDNPGAVTTLTRIRVQVVGG